MMRAPANETEVNVDGTAHWVCYQEAKTEVKTEAKDEGQDVHWLMLSRERANASPRPSTGAQRCRGRGGRVGVLRPD